jgi:hypothetical protein
MSESPNMPEFRPWPKIPRANKPLIITEKIDGTNAIIHIADNDFVLTAGSRTRWLGRVSGFRSAGAATDIGNIACDRELFDKDNFGFFAWCSDNAVELMKLGPGYHYGEWYGQGIQRTYGLDHKRFALFNTARWSDGRAPRPACCGVVPILPFQDAKAACDFLRSNGSVAVPGFMRPEGIVVLHTGASTMQKILLENDDVPKSLVKGEE